MIEPRYRWDDIMLPLDPRAQRRQANGPEPRLETGLKARGLAG